MELFKKLPVLEALKATYPHGHVDLNRVYIVSVQHLLETTGSLFQAIIEIGVNPKNIYLCGKVYSTHNTTFKKIESLGINVVRSRIPDTFGTIRESLKKDVAALWEMVKSKLKAGDTVIVLDDGGLTINKIPKELLQTCRFFGIEQTTFGLRYQKEIEFPIIEVATSAAKKHLEPNLISMALLNKLRGSLKELNPTRIGVVGFGNIGKAVVRGFKKNHQVFAFDKNTDSSRLEYRYVNFCSSAEELISKCEIVIGATGFDFSRNVNWGPLINEDKLLISVSSGDLEFNTLLKKHHNYIPNTRQALLASIEIPFPNGRKITLYRGGTVANFDGSKESCPAEQIQLTRGLLFAAVLQTLDCHSMSCDKKGSVMLDPARQIIITSCWFQAHPEFKYFYPEALVNNFKFEKWIENNSGGML